jgi:regulatory protein
MTGDQPTRGSGSRDERARGRGRRGETNGRRRGARSQEPPRTGAAAVDGEPDPESVARNIALRMLTGAPRSRAQLEQAMAKKDVPQDVARRVLDRFTEVGLIDDAAYAGMLVRTRHSERGLARRALAMELRKRGIDGETAETALEEVDSESEEEAARHLVSKRLRSMSGLDRQVKRRRLAGMLGRKGYPPGVALRVVDDALRGEGDAELDDDGPDGAPD